MRKILVGVAILAVLGLLLRNSQLETEAEVLQDLLAKEQRVSAEPIVDKKAIAAEPEEAASAPESDEPTVTLAQEKQTKIWDLEHITFELEWKFGKLIKDAVKNREQAGLLGCFKAGFVGKIPVDADRQQDQGEWWFQDFRQSSADARQIASAEELSNWLLDVLEPWDSIDKVGLRVLAIDKTSQENEYQLRILLTAQGVEKRRQRSMQSEHDVLVACENDEEIEAGKIVAVWETDFVEVRGSDQVLMKEVTEQVGLKTISLPDNWKNPAGSAVDSYTSQIAVSDFDLDGYLDIAVSTIQGQQYLLRSVEGKRFEDVTESVGLPSSRFFSYTTFATWIDYDNDGYPDLLLGKNLYKNVQGSSFKHVTQSVGLKFKAATMGAAVVDFDCDGFLDLYVLNHMGDRGNKKVGFVDDDRFTGVANELWRNTGKGSFEEVTEQAGISGDLRHSFAAAWFHANEDHYPDLYLVNDFGRNCMYINQGDGSFTDVTEVAGVGDFANSMGVAAGDLDNDGKSEIYVANMFSKMGRRIIAHVCADDYPEGVYEGIQGACAGSHLYQPGDSEQYQEISLSKKVNAIGWAYAPVFADFDSDGFLDIYATSGFISVDRHKPDG